MQKLRIENVQNYLTKTIKLQCMHRTMELGQILKCLHVCSTFIVTYQNYIDTFILRLTHEHDYIFEFLDFCTRLPSIRLITLHTLNAPYAIVHKHSLLE